VQRGPMPLLPVREPFDGNDWIFELKLDGFRALAHLDGDRCELVSRNGNAFSKWDSLKADLARSVRATSAVMDGEIVCMDAAGASDFYALMFNRRAPVFCAFDLLAMDGQLPDGRRVHTRSPGNGDSTMRLGTITYRSGDRLSSSVHVPFRSPGRGSGAGRQGI
jgi:ATP-dependent DNA ligase